MLGARRRYSLLDLLNGKVIWKRNIGGVNLCEMDLSIIEY